MLVDYLELLQGETTSSTDPSVVSDGGASDLWPQWPSDRTGSDATGLSLASLMPDERQLSVKLSQTIKTCIYSTQRYTAPLTFAMNSVLHYLQRTETKSCHGQQKSETIVKMYNCL